MLTIIIDNSVAIYSTTLAELLDILVKEKSIKDTQESKDFTITEYVMESYYMVAQAGSEEELFASMKSVPVPLEGVPKVLDSKDSNVSIEQVAELSLGLLNLRTQAEELLPGVNRIAKALGEKMGNFQDGLMGLLGKNALSAEEAALLGNPKGEA